MRERECKYFGTAKISSKVPTNDYSFVKAAIISISSVYNETSDKLFVKGVVVVIIPHRLPGPGFPLNTFQLLVSLGPYLHW